MFLKSSTGLNKVMHDHRRETELTHSGISSPMQPPLLMTIVEAVGLGSVFPVDPYPLTWFKMAWLVHAGTPMAAAKMRTLKENSSTG